MCCGNVGVLLVIMGYYFILQTAGRAFVVCEFKNLHRAFQCYKFKRSDKLTVETPTSKIYRKSGMV